MAVVHKKCHFMCWIKHTPDGEPVVSFAQQILINDLLQLATCTHNQYESSSNSASMAFQNK